MEKPTVNQETVDLIVDMTTSKCFDYAQMDGSGIAETVAEVAAALAIYAVSLKHDQMLDL